MYSLSGTLGNLIASITPVVTLRLSSMGQLMETIIHQGHQGQDERRRHEGRDCGRMGSFPTKLTPILVVSYTVIQLYYFLLWENGVIPFEIDSNFSGEI